MFLFMENNDNLQETFSSFIQISVSGSDDYIKVRCLLRLDRLCLCITECIYRYARQEY